MAKDLVASAGSWTGTIRIPNKVRRDFYLAVMSVLRAEREKLYTARNSNAISMKEWQDKTGVISGLIQELDAAYSADTPSVEWSQA